MRQGNWYTDRSSSLGTQSSKCSKRLAMEGTSDLGKTRWISERATFPVTDFSCGKIEFSGEKAGPKIFSPNQAGSRMTMFSSWPSLMCIIWGRRKKGGRKEGRGREEKGREEGRRKGGRKGRREGAIIMSPEDGYQNFQASCLSFFFSFFCWFIYNEGFLCNICRCKPKNK